MSRREKIRAVLMNLSIDPALNGFEYLVEAVDFVVDDKTNKRNRAVIQLYEDVAAIYGTTQSRVERGIRHAIERGFDLNQNLLYKVFDELIPSHSGKVKNSTFIAVVAERMIAGKFIFAEVVENGIE